MFYILHPRLATTCIFHRVASWMQTRLSCLHLEKKRLCITKYNGQHRQMSENASRNQPSFKCFWQPGSAFYGDSLGKTGRYVNDLCEDYLLSHLDYVPVPSPSGVFTIGDYGTCDGFASQQLIEKLIFHLRNKYGSDLNIQVLYEDQPTNDFNSLFKRVYDATSYMSKFSKVFPLACGSSFYHQCVPDNSCDVIISTLAAHWLSEESVFQCSESIFPMVSASQEEMRVYQEVCQRDWEKFLLHRAAELKPGGILFVAQHLSSAVTPMKSSSETWADKDGCMTYFHGGQDILLGLNTSWKDLYKQGIISQEEFKACIVRVSARTLQETKAPFENAIRRTRLCLLQEPEQMCIPYRAKQLWRLKLKKDGVDDRKRFADLLTKDMRVWTEASFRNSLVNTRTAYEQSDIIERLYDTFRSKVSAVEPDIFLGDLTLSRLIAQKSV